MVKYILSLCMVLALQNHYLPAQETDPKTIIDKAEKKYKGNTGYGEMTMKIIRPDWSREISLKSWSKGTDLSLILVTAPARDEGTAFLKTRKEIRTWQPTIERVIKLPPSMMGQSWMSSDFTNDDLVKEASFIEDYYQKLLGDEEVEDRLCYKIELTPKEDAAVVWGKVVTWIDKEELIYMKTEYYDEDGYLINTLIASDIGPLGGRTLARKLEMIPADKKGNKTVIIYQYQEFDKPIEDDFFSIQNMKKVR
jgi:outer membrane lipoprotein-sorting protein